MEEKEIEKMIGVNIDVIEALLPEALEALGGEKLRVNGVCGQASVSRPNSGDDSELSKLLKITNNCNNFKKIVDIVCYNGRCSYCQAWEPKEKPTEPVKIALTKKQFIHEVKIHDKLLIEEFVKNIEDVELRSVQINIRDLLRELREEYERRLKLFF